MLSVPLKTLRAFRLANSEGFWKSNCVKSVQIRSFFWSVFSRIQTEYGEIRISPYSIRMLENTDQEKLRILTLFTQSRGHYLVYQISHSSVRLSSYLTP